MSGVSRRILLSAFIGIALCGSIALSGGVWAQATGGPSPRVALKGYDPVSYFTDGKPEQGSKEFTFAFDDTTYWFKSAEHRDKFASDPEHYAPQFDGYCAVQLSWGHKVEADPQAWTITDGKLYVFAIKKGVKKFESETVAIVDKAKENWPKLRDQKAEPSRGPPSPGRS